MGRFFFGFCVITLRLSAACLAVFSFSAMGSSGALSSDSVSAIPCPYLCRGSTMSSLTPRKLERLINRGESVRGLGRYGETPLHWASAYNRLDLMSVLLRRGADSDARDDSGASPILWAAWQGRPWVEGVTDFSLGDDDDESRTLFDIILERSDYALPTAAKRNPWDDLPSPLAPPEVAVSAVTLLVDSGVVPPMRQLMLLALARQNSVLAEHLLKIDGSISNASRFLHMAAYMEDETIFRLLLDYGALPNLPGPNGDRPIEMAIFAGRFKNVELLLRYGADVSFVSERGDSRNVLHLAAELGDERSLEALLGDPRTRPLLNEGDSEGRTPLHAAVLAGTPRIVSSMLDAGGDAGVPDDRGVTPAGYFSGNANIRSDTALLRRLHEEAAL